MKDEFRTRQKKAVITVFLPYWLIKVFCKKKKIFSATIGFQLFELTEKQYNDFSKKNSNYRISNKKWKYHTTKYVESFIFGRQVHYYFVTRFYSFSDGYAEEIQKLYKSERTYAGY